MTEEQKLPDAAAVKEWLVQYVANLLEFEHSEVRTNLPLSRYGLDSMAAVGLMGDLGKWLGRKVDPMLLYKYKTIDTMADHIAANCATMAKPER